MTVMFIWALKLHSMRILLAILEGWFFKNNKLFKRY